jgi:hypothetical protein
MIPSESLHREALGCETRGPYAQCDALPWDAATDFILVTVFAQTRLLFVVSPTLKNASPTELVAFAKSNPCKLSYSSAV